MSLFIGLFINSLHAQISSAGPADTSSQVSDQRSTANTHEEARFAPALDGSGLIPMDSTISKHLLVGGTIAGGWDSNPNNSPDGTSSGIYTLSPYFGIQSNTSHRQLLLQYQPTLTRYSSSDYTNQTMHAATATIFGKVNERWTWNLIGSGNHGTDATRFLAPQQSVAVGEVPGTNPSSASYLANAGTVTFATGSAGARYRISERDSLDFSVANTYSRYSGINQSNSIAATSLGYRRDLSPSVEIRTYGQTYYYYGAINCASFGGGLGIKWHVFDGSFLSLSGGPQLDTAACGKQQVFSYSGAFSTRLTGKSQIYLLAARQPAVSYQGPGLWQTSASAGYQRQISNAATLKLDVGYVRSNTLTSANSYSGTYFDCVYGVRLGRGFSLAYNYRGFVGDTGGTGFSRNVALFSLAWTPNAGHLFQ